MKIWLPTSLKTVEDLAHFQFATVEIVKPLRPRHDLCPHQVDLLSTQPLGASKWDPQITLS